jgi:hypothetical protein
MKYIVENNASGMIYVPSFMKIISGIQIILLLLSQQIQRFYRLYYY